MSHSCRCVTRVAACELCDALDEPAGAIDERLARATRVYFWEADADGAGFRLAAFRLAP